MAKFERELARKFRAKHAISFSSARSALYWSLRALGITHAEVILPAYTCVVVAHAVAISKNIPVFVDISLDDFNLDLDQLRGKNSKNTKVIIATSLFGYPVDLNEIRKICGPDVLLIHDCALAPGVEAATNCGESDLTLYSFNVRKPISTLGGGMLTTSNDEIYQKIRTLVEENRKKHNTVQRLNKSFFFLSQFVAFNKQVHTLVDFLANRTHLLDGVLNDYSVDLEKIPSSYFFSILGSQAKIGLAQLEKFDAMLRRRRGIAMFYYENLKDESAIAVPPIVEGGIYSHYPVRVKDRDTFVNKMRKQDISVGNYFNYCIPELQAYRQYKNGDFPNAVICSQEIVNLPNHPGLTQRDLEYVVQSVRDCLPTSISINPERVEV